MLIIISDPLIFLSKFLSSCVEPNYIEHQVQIDFHGKVPEGEGAYFVEGYSRDFIHVLLASLNFHIIRRELYNLFLCEAWGVL